MKVAILDDYQNVALQLADWSSVRRYAEITVFNDHIADSSAVIERLRPFQVVCVMRERTPLPQQILQQLPRDRETPPSTARPRPISALPSPQRVTMPPQPLSSLGR